MKRSQASSPAAQDTQSAQASKRQKLSDGDKHEDMDDAGEWTKVEKSKRFPKSPETGGQEDYVKAFRRITGNGLSSAPLLRPSMHQMATVV